MDNDKSMQRKSEQQASNGLALTRETPVEGRRELGKARRQKSDPSQPISIGSVLKSIGQWWKIATPVGVGLALIAGAIVIYSDKPVYQASALIQIKDTTPYIAHRPKEDGKRFAETQVQILKSSIVLGPVLSDPQVAALEPIKNCAAGTELDFLADSIGVRSIGNSELYEVSSTSSDAKSSAVIANAVIDSFFKMHTEYENRSTHRVLELLNEERKRRGQEVELQREQVRELSKKVIGRDPFTGHSTPNIVLLNQPLETLHQQLSQAEVDRQILEAQATAWQESIETGNATVSQVMVDRAFRQHPEVVNIITAQGMGKAKLRGIEERSVHGKNDPYYGRVQNELVKLKKAMENLRETLAPELKEELMTTALSERKGRLDEMQQQLKDKKLLENLLKKKYKEHIARAGENGSESVNLEFARAELMRQELVFEKISDRALQLSTEMRAPPRVIPREEAEAPTAPLPSSAPKKALIAMLGCFLAPFAVAVLWERFVKRIGDSKELETQAELDVVAEIARLPMRARMNGHNYTGNAGRALSVFEESVDSLRTTLLLSENEDLQVVTVASAVPSEGKTSVASQLAVSIARSAGGPVLLIDADMRSPDVHRIFQIPNEPGFAEVLDGECSLEGAIDTTWSDHIHLLPAGRLHKSPHHLVGTGELEKIMRRVRKQYRRIIIDVPPVLSASESLVLAKEADGVLMCAMQDYSRSGQVRLAYQRLEASGANMLGAVLNGVSPRKYTFTYGKYAYGYNQEPSSARGNNGQPDDKSLVAP